SHIVIGFSQDALFGFGDVEAEILASFGERGFRFALTGVRDPDLDAGALHTLGVRYMRVASTLLTDPEAAKTSDLHPADLPGLMRRHATLLVAEDADTAHTVADLLYLHVRAAPAALFGVPRPVRPEIFSGEEPKPQAPPVQAAERPVPQKPFRSIARRA